MSPVTVMSGPPHDCGRDGHRVAVRFRHEAGSTSVSATGFCERCGRVFLPSIALEGPVADGLMRFVRSCAVAPDAADAQYAGLYAD